MVCWNFNFAKFYQQGTGNEKDPAQAKLWEILPFSSSVQPFPHPSLPGTAFLTTPPSQQQVPWHREEDSMQLLVGLNMGIIGHTSKTRALSSMGKVVRDQVQGKSPLTDKEVPEGTDWGQAHLNLGPSPRHRGQSPGFTFVLRVRRSKETLAPGT